MSKSPVRILFAFVILASLLAACSQNQDGFVKVKGDGVTFSEYFKPYDRLDEREHVTFYKPLSLDEAAELLPASLKKQLAVVDANMLPFRVEEEKAFLVTSKNTDGKLQNQLQLSYLAENEGAGPDDFLIISVTETDENPLASFELNEAVDTVGNELVREQLKDGQPLYGQMLTTDSALLYRYYEWDGKKITVVGTAANEWYAYSDGRVYHVGYSAGPERNDAAVQEQMLELVKEFIGSGADGEA